MTLYRTAQSDTVPRHHPFKTITYYLLWKKLNLTYFGPKISAKLKWDLTLYKIPVQYLLDWHLVGQYIFFVVCKEVFCICLPLFREKRVCGCDLRWWASRVIGLPLCWSVALFKTPPGAAIKCECPCVWGMAGLGRPGGFAELSGWCATPLLMTPPLTEGPS